MISLALSYNVRSGRERSGDLTVSKYCLDNIRQVTSAFGGLRPDETKNNY